MQNESKHWKPTHKIELKFTITLILTLYSILVLFKKNKIKKKIVNLKKKTFSCQFIKESFSCLDKKRKNYCWIALVTREVSTLSLQQVMQLLQIVMLFQQVLQVSSYSSSKRYVEIPLVNMTKSTKRRIIINMQVLILFRLYVSRI